MHTSPWSLRTGERYKLFNCCAVVPEQMEKQLFKTAAANSDLDVCALQVHSWKNKQGYGGNFIVSL